MSSRWVSRASRCQMDQWQRCLLHQLSVIVCQTKEKSSPLFWQRHSGPGGEWLSLWRRNRSYKYNCGFYEFPGKNVIEFRKRLRKFEVLESKRKWLAARTNTENHWSGFSSSENLQRRERTRGTATMSHTCVYSVITLTARRGRQSVHIGPLIGTRRFLPYVNTSAYLPLMSSAFPKYFAALFFIMSKLNHNLRPQFLSLVVY